MPGELLASAARHHPAAAPRPNQPSAVGPRTQTPVLLGTVMLHPELAPDRVDRSRTARAREHKMVAPAVLPSLNVVTTLLGPITEEDATQPDGPELFVGLLSMATMSDLWAHDNNLKWRTSLKKLAAVRILAMEVGKSAGSSGIDLVDYSCGLPSHSLCHGLRSWRRMSFFLCLEWASIVSSARCARDSLRADEMPWKRRRSRPGRLR